MLKCKSFSLFVIYLIINTLIFLSACNPTVDNFNYNIPKATTSNINYYKDSLYINSSFIPSSFNYPIDSASYDSNFNYKVTRYYSNDTLLRIDTILPKVFVGQKINDSVFVAAINTDSVTLAIAIKSWIYDSNNNPIIKVVGFRQTDLYKNLNPPANYRYLDTAAIPSLFLCFSKTNLNNTILGRNIWTNIVVNNDYGIIAVPRPNFNALGELKRINYNIGFWIKKISTREALNTFNSKEYIIIK